MALTLSEYKMTGLHKAAIAQARRGRHQSASTKAKISGSMAGKTNHAGSTHTEKSKDRIRHKRGHDDRIDGKRWIVNSRDKTYRRNKAPEGFKLGQRKFDETNGKFNESSADLMSFAEYLYSIHSSFVYSV
jgi:hypothetical protein